MVFDVDVVPAFDHDAIEVTGAASVVLHTKSDLKDPKHSLLSVTSKVGRVREHLFQILVRDPLDDRVVPRRNRL